MSDSSNSRIHGFYRLTPDARSRIIQEFSGVTEEQMSALTPDVGLPLSRANRMIENVAGVFCLPIGFAPNFRVDGVDYILPMVVEEPSVVAAAANGARLLREGAGIQTTTTAPIMIAQIQLLDLPDPGDAVARIQAARPELMQRADETRPSLVDRGGGCRDVTVRQLANTRSGDMVIVHLHVDVRDAMGANIVTTMAERLAPFLEQLTGGRAGLRILSNLASERLVTAEGRIPLRLLEHAAPGYDGVEVARRIEEASVFAEVDPYRAATHNKGIMNGIDAVLVATGQDWRAVEAGAHAYAARSGSYSALATWRLEGDQLVGRLTLPMQVGTVGGIIGVHHTVDLMLRVLNVEGADHLGRIAAAAGLAQNLSAVLKLATEGVRRGHMALHARNIAVQAGAEGPEVDRVVRAMVDTDTFDSRSAQRIVAALRQPQVGQPPLAGAPRA
ncbi:MAG: hydroxymethylglutaryl-CoA reductase [Myxococcota bacterium]|jgi:hydroxymethylglutaryl-CoA reductase